MEAGDIDEELGVAAEYADEIRERMGEEGVDNSYIGAVERSLESDETRKQFLTSTKESGHWTALLLAAVADGLRETERLAAEKSDKKIVREYAVSLFRERLVERAIDGTLFDPLYEEHPDTFRELIVHRFSAWAVENAQNQVLNLEAQRQ